MNRVLHEGMDKEASLSKDVNTIRKVLGWDEQPTPTQKEKPTMEGYAAWLRTEKCKKKTDDEIQNAIHEGFQENMDRLEKTMEEYVRARDS